MNNLKNFFDKIKKDKFKRAGHGKSLSSDSAPSSSARRSAPAPRQLPSASSHKAGQAALDRFSNNPKNVQVDWSVQAIKAQARRELEAEKKMQELSMAQQAAAAAQPRRVELEAAPVQHVMFSNPLMGSEVGTYDEMKESISAVLHSQLGEDQAVATCLIIHSCNKGQEKIKVCVETLCKYIENIVQHPDEDKFRRVRQSNKAYLERVKPLDGAEQFLSAAGFETHLLPFNDTEDNFWVFPADGDLERLEGLSASLMVAEAVRPALERSPVVLLPQQSAKQPQLPPEFYTISKEELQREMQIRNEVVEQSMMLRTKAMRERQNQKEIRKYRFTFVRVRFNDGLTLQGTFRISDKLKDVREFIREYLINDWRPFCLCPSGGKKFGSEDEERSLAELYLAPAALLVFLWDGDISDDNLDDMQLLGPAAYDLIDQQQQED